MPVPDFQASARARYLSARRWTLQGRAHAWRTALAAALAVTLAGCAPTIIKHGHQFQDDDIQKIQVGMSGQQVSGVLGSPTTTAKVASGDAYYYIASVEKQTAFFSPEETDRKVLVVYFGPQGAVERTAQYGLKDGKLIKFSKDTTPDSAKEQNVIKSLFRNLGTKQLYGE